jgi:hypothetical protein
VDDTDSEYVGLTSESETFDYMSEGEDVPLPRKILKEKINTRDGSNNKKGDIRRK